MPPISLVGPQDEFPVDAAKGAPSWRAYEPYGQPAKTSPSDDESHTKPSSSTTHQNQEDQYDPHQWPYSGTYALPAQPAHTETGHAPKPAGGSSASQEAKGEHDDYQTPQTLTTKRAANPQSRDRY